MKESTMQNSEVKVGFTSVKPKSEDILEALIQKQSWCVRTASSFERDKNLLCVLAVGENYLMFL